MTEQNREKEKETYAKSSGAAGTCEASRLCAKLKFPAPA